MSNARLVAIIASLVLSGILLYLLAPALTPFVVGALLAYISNPIVRGLERWRVPRIVGVMLVFLLFVAIFLALILYLVPLLRSSFAGFAERLPGYYDWLIAQAPRLEAWLGLSLHLDLQTLRENMTGHWQEAGQWVTRALGVATQSGLTVIGWLVNLVLIPIITFYLLLDWDRIVGHIDALVPPRYQVQSRQLARETDAVLASFLRGQLMVMVVLAFVYSIGLLLVGLELALPIGLFTGLLTFVPYLGFVSGLIAAMIAGYLQFHDTTMLLWVLAVFLVGQSLESYVLTPRLVGKRIGLHPVAVIFALLAGAQLFGFFGLLVALPVAAALKVWLRHVHESLVRAPARPRKR